MAGWQRVVELAMTCEEIERLTALSRSRTEPASRVSRAQMLLAYRENPSFCAVGQRVGVHHQTVQRCVERALGYGPLAAIEDRPRPGKEPVIAPEAKACCGARYSLRTSARPGWGKAPQPHTGEDDKDIRVTIRTITEGRGNGKPLTAQMSL